MTLPPPAAPACCGADLATRRGSPTALQSGQLGIDTRLGVAISARGGTSRLVVYGAPIDGRMPILAVRDVISFVLTNVPR